ncbi:FtsW/RodA/SpoVE family cell cycle protein [bacterium]|nr:FtsW/RodA/SpoVE family cell cycle protein [candidate division CSSED10-310 bacterium]
MSRRAKQRRYFLARSDEFWLLCITMAVVTWLFLGGMSVRMNDNGLDPVDWLLPGVFFLSVFAAHGLLVFAGSRADETILPVGSILVGIGLAYQYRLGGSAAIDIHDAGKLVLLMSPLVIAAVSILFRRNRLEWLRKPGWFWVVLTIAIPVAMLFWGVDYRGSRFGPMRTTPAEYGKLAALLAYTFILCRYGDSLDKQRKLFSAEANRAHRLISAVWIPAPFLYAMHRDLGIVLISAVLILALLHTATGRRVYWLAGITGAVAGGWLFRSYVSRGAVRFQAWLEPFDHPADAGYQIIQSLFALFHGEVIGRGVGEGFPRKIPLVHTDFVYASIAEETGLLGSGLVLFLFFYLSRRAMAAAGRSESLFQILLATGAGTLIWVQVLLNVGGVIKLIPMTGVPLPFISLGGSATLVFSILTGWILAVSDVRDEVKRSAPK